MKSNFLVLFVLTYIAIGCNKNDMVSVKDCRMNIHINKENSFLESNRIFSLIADDNANVYFTIRLDNGIQNKIYQISGVNEKLIEYKIEGFNEKYSLDRITNVTAKKTVLRADGWPDKGNAVVIKESGSYNIYHEDNSELSGRTIQTAKILNNKLYVCISEAGFNKYGGLYVYDFNSWIVYNRENGNLNATSVFDVVEDSNGDIWGITNSELIQVHNDELTSIHLMSNAYRIAITEADDIYLATSKGVLKMKDGIVIETFSFENSNLPSKAISDLAISLDNRVIIGTKPYVIGYDVVGDPIFSGGGLAVMISDEISILNVENSILPSNIVESVTVGSENELYVVTQDGITIICEY